MKLRSRSYLLEGYNEYKKDPKFFDEKRLGGMYIGTYQTRRGIKYQEMSRYKVVEIMKNSAGKEHPDGWLAIYFVPVEYTKGSKGRRSSKNAISEIERGMFKPIWDWGRGKLKGGFA